MLVLTTAQIMFYRASKPGWNACFDKQQMKKKKCITRIMIMMNLSLSLNIYSKIMKYLSSLYY